MEDTNDLQKKLESIKNMQEGIQEYQSIDTISAYHQTIRKIKRKSGKLIFFNWYQKVAAMIVIPLIISVCGLLYLINQPNKLQNIRYTEIKAAPGTIVLTELPDQSQVWLNSGSSLRYPNVFSDSKRTVELSGEAFFDVEADPKHPFEVMIPSGIQVAAYGTKFNIYAYEDDHFNEIVLKDGLVEVTCLNKKIPMEPNEMVSFDIPNNQWKKGRTSVDEKIAWKDGILIFRNTPLSQVMKQLSRRYNVDIQVHHAKKTDYKIRATFSSETITQILDVLKMAVPMEWQITDIEQNQDSTFDKQRIDIQIK